MAAPLFAELAGARNWIFAGVFLFSVGATCAMLALTPASSLASRVIFDRWSRAEIHRYPQVINELPDGVTVLNLIAPLNFVMTGERLARKVVAHFEARGPVTDRRPTGRIKVD